MTILDSQIIGSPDGGVRRLLLRDIVTARLPQQRIPDRWIAKALAAVARRHVRAIHGLENIGAERDPFILALNHSTRLEAVLAPALLLLHRRGRPIHFLADWNFQLIPGVGYIYRRSGVITVTRKSARPAFLNILKPFFAGERQPFEQARERLEAGYSIGVFPEGTVNRDPRRLLRGRPGAARLSLETGVPVAPAGIRVAPDGCIEIHIGSLLHPPTASASVVPLAEVKAWHAIVMTDIGRLSGKCWAPQEVQDAQ